jgi:hypothetical protein
MKELPNWTLPFVGLLFGLLIAAFCILRNDWRWEAATLVPGPLIGFLGGCLAWFQRRFFPGVHD